MNKRSYNNWAISYDPTKRNQTLRLRGLDFDDAVRVFDGMVIDIPDLRHDYGEQRIVTVGYLQDRMVIVVWTARDDDTRHIISMRKANEREQKLYGERLG
jgi:uncharacterized DUF497 family protein